MHVVQKAYLKKTNGCKAPSYGLTQGPRTWHQTVDAYTLKIEAYNEFMDGPYKALSTGSLVYDFLYDIIQ